MAPSTEMERDTGATVAAIRIVDGSILGRAIGTGIAMLLLRIPVILIVATANVSNGGGVADLGGIAHWCVSMTMSVSVRRIVRLMAPVIVGTRNCTSRQ